MNTAASIRARHLHESKKIGGVFLKGAMLIVAWGGRLHRPTKDLDLLGVGDPGQADVARRMRKRSGMAPASPAASAIQSHADINDGKGFLFVSHTGETFPSGSWKFPVGNVRTRYLTDAYRRVSAASAATARLCGALARGRSL